jgi:cyclophilin family peptidyl-prolyl cis-trans isomerase
VAGVARAVAGDDPTLALDEAIDTPIRAALTPGLDDIEALVRLAVSDQASSIRIAAALALSDKEHSPDDVRALLGAQDEAVREVAVELAVQAGLEAELVALATTEADPGVLQALIDGLLQGPAARLPALSDTVLRLAQHPQARVRSLARRAVTHFSLVLDPATVAPDPRAPALAEVQRIASAKVDTDRGSFRIALRPDLAPYAVANFASLAEAGFYDGLPFHRVLPGFVAQTGCPRGDGWGGPGWTIPDELSREPFDRGAVGMARADHDTGGSQWFVTTSPQPHLDGEYTVFGRVDHNLHVVEHLERGDLIVAVEIERRSP